LRPGTCGIGVAFSKGKPDVTAGYKKEGNKDKWGPRRKFELAPRSGAANFWPGREPAKSRLAGLGNSVINKLSGEKGATIMRTKTKVRAGAAIWGG